MLRDQTIDWNPMIKQEIFEEKNEVVKYGGKLKFTSGRLFSSTKFLTQILKNLEF